MLIRLAAALTLVAGTAAAVDWKALKPTGYLNDYAQVVDLQSSADLELYLAAVNQSTGAQVVLVTVRSLEGEPIEDAADAIFRSWGIGEKGKNNGVLLLLAIDDRKSRLEVGYGLEPVLTDAYAGRVLDAMRPDLRQSRYGPALLEAAQTIGDEIAKAEGVEITGVTRRPPSERPANPSRFISWIFYAIIAYAFLGRGGRRRRPMAYLPTDGGGWSGGSSHGGFGGYDSGGSFGGFGGGDSGGGGASSDW